MNLQATTDFAIMSIMAFAACAWIFFALRKNDASSSAIGSHGRRNLLDNMIILLARFALGLRYRIKIKGLDDIKSKGQRGILFLPNHPALIDPVIMISILHKNFSPRSIADELRVNLPVIGWLSKRFGARLIPDMAKDGAGAAEDIKTVLSKTVRGLQKGENLLLYPAGHLKWSREEEIGATSAVEAIIKGVPDLRVVLVRQNGLWGSSFSWASGRYPGLTSNMKRNFKFLFLNGIFFMPRRPVEIEFYEPEAFSQIVDRIEMNRFMEDFYNKRAWPNTYVPYLFREGGGIRVLPEPEFKKIKGDIDTVPETTRELVKEYLEKLTGVTDIKEEHLLAYDLGLDSLAVQEVILWLEKEFGFLQSSTESLKTVGDVMLAAMGKGMSSGLAPLKPVSRKWFLQSPHNRMLSIPEGTTITEVFLRQAKKNPGKVIIADQSGGEKTYRDIITAILVLKPLIEALPGSYVGIMLPATAGTSILFLSALFAGKIPVMVNWTSGPRYMAHSLDLIGVKTVLTSKILVNRLKAQGIRLDEISNRFMFIEDIAGSVSFRSRLGAYIRSYLNWARLRDSEMADIAVILFTSGSETLPKAVPLSHKNILTNIRDTPLTVLSENDALIGILPPFHSFGITVTTVLPLCTGLRTVYHTNPIEAPVIARMIKEYKVSIIVGTPTFLSGIIQASTKVQLRPLRLAIIGADKCPDAVHEAFKERCPQANIIEGYGVTECSPIVSVTPEDYPKLNTIGRILPSFEYRIVDVDTGKNAGKNRAGMLLLRGASVFDGYLNYDGDSPFVEYEGKKWYRTGDLVMEGEGADGVLVFCGRLKRFVKLGGEMISLPAIEEVLSNHIKSDNGEGPVIAVEATTAEETPELTLFTARDTDRATVNNYIRDAGLSALHNIRRVIKTDEIPLLGTGKIDYRLLRERLNRDLGPAQK